MTFDVSVKNEVKIENDLDNLNIKTDDESTSAQSLPYPSSIDELFSRTTPQMFLLQVNVPMNLKQMANSTLIVFYFQLPDTLPGHGPVEEPAESSEHERPDQPNPNSSFCTMNQLEEGRIGQLVRYRSGRTKLILGDSQFNIDLGIDPGLLQEVVSISTNTAERSGNMINVGRIGAKCCAIPDWEYMICNS